MIQAKSFRIDLSSCEDPSERIEKEVDRLSKEESEIEITHVVQTACGPYNQNLVTTIFYKIK